MANVMKITIFAFLCPATLAVDCISQPDLCSDETSLLQVRKDIRQHSGQDEIRQVPTTFNQSEVEAAQNKYKEAYSNTSIAKYVYAQAKLQESQALYDAAKAQRKAEGDTAANVNAVRMAGAAVQAAQDNLDAWQAAMAADQDKAMASGMASADYYAKHNLSNYLTANTSATWQQLQDAQKAEKQTQVNQQAMVNEAAAEAAATWALGAKKAAAQQTAIQKEVAATEKQKEKIAKAANKLAMKSYQRAVADELKASKVTMKAQASAQKAAASQMLADQAAAIAAAPAALLEQPTQTVTTVTTVVEDVTDSTAVPIPVYNDSKVQEAMLNASIATDAARTYTSQVLSDYKKSKAASQIGKYAADVAKPKMKAAQAQSDWQYRKAMHAQHLANQAALAARRAMEATKQSQWNLNNSGAANASAWVIANVAENYKYKTAQALRDALDNRANYSTNLTAITDDASRQKVITDAAADKSAAGAAANTAATSRAVSNYAKAFNEAASLNASVARANLTMANKDMHATGHVSNKAEGQAMHAAHQANLYDWKAAPYQNLGDASDQTQTVVQTQTVTQVVSR